MMMTRSAVNNASRGTECTASGLGRMPPPSIQEEPSAEERIQAHEPMPYISKYELFLQFQEIMRS